MKKTYYDEMCLTLQIQDTLGTPQAVTPDALLVVRDITTNILTGDTKELNYPMKGVNSRARPVAMLDPQNGFGFKIDLTTPLVGKEPSWIRLFRACGFNVIEHPDMWELELSKPSEMDAATVRLYQEYDETGDHEYVAYDASGNISLDFKMGEVPEASIPNMAGTYLRPEVVNQFVPNYDGLLSNVPEALNAAKVNEVTLGGTGLCLTALSIPDADGRDMGRDKASCGDFTIGAQKPIVPKITIYNTDWKNEVNPFQISEAMEQIQRMPFVFDIDLMRVEIDEVQPLNPKPVKLGKAGLLGLELDLNCLVNPKYFINKVVA